MTPPEIVDEWVRCIESRDIARAAALLSPHSVTRDEATREHFVGRQGFLAYSSTWTSAFSIKAKAMAIRAATEPDTHVVDFEFAMTHVGTWFSGRFGPIPATHRQVLFTFSEQCRVEGDAIVELRLFYNRLRLLRDLGVDLNLSGR